MTSVVGSVAASRHAGTTSCPSGSTGERPVTPGATSRSGCRSRWTPSAPSSSTSIRATTPQRHSAPGVRRTANSGRRSGNAASGSKSWPSVGPGGKSAGRRPSSPTGREIPGPEPVRLIARSSGSRPRRKHQIQHRCGGMPKAGCRNAGIVVLIRSPFHLFSNARRQSYSHAAPKVALGGALGLEGGP